MLDANAIAVQDELPVDVVAYANPVLLHGVAENLVKNAASSRSMSTLNITFRHESEQIIIRLDNQPQTEFMTDEVGRMFAPSWRKEVSRAAGENNALGLTVVRTYCAAISGAVEASRTKSGRLRIETRFPSGSSEPGDREAVAEASGVS